MPHPLFRKEIFVETAFERRFQAMLRFALHQRSWHVIVADPGAGKTMGIRDLIRTTGSPPLLAITAPKNNDEELALGNQLASALGLPLRGRWSERKPKLMGAMVQLGVKCLIVDDAQDLSLEHLMFIKELTDQGQLHYGYQIGLCLVTAGRGNTIPLKEIFDQPDTMWLQFRRRLDKLNPFCQVEGHTSEEVREILATLEAQYCDVLPQLNLHQWSTVIYTWLTQPILDPTYSGRVTMDYLMKLVTTALEWSYAAGETDVRAETLEKAASLLVLRRDTLWRIDGAGPSIEVSPSEPGIESKTESEPEAVQAHERQNLQTGQTLVEDNPRPTQTTKCTFSGVISIELQHFLDSSTRRVECPYCGATRSLDPRGGSLRFRPHDKRKTTTPHTEPRWVWHETGWMVVGG